ncbi:hypothetical protein BHM03_00032972 [Ensete ventricosum]|nr:hypothetical protein BHM03_00032972 [Ensete ventricosum]
MPCHIARYPRTVSSKARYAGMVDPANVRPVEEGDALLEAEREAEATRQAIKRKIAQAATTDFQARTLPAKLRIDPNDPDDVVSKLTSCSLWFPEPSNWVFSGDEYYVHYTAYAICVLSDIMLPISMPFGSLSIGFFSGRKRESIFKSPDDPRGKVGVTGSGKGLTEFQKREKHLHLKGGSVDTED